MFPASFTLLQQEGFLMQGCFKASLSVILAAPNAQPGPFYAAFFNYSIGLERLLKILLMLDKWHCERQFLTNEELKGKGHNLSNLYKEVRSLFPPYRVIWESSYEPDEITSDLLDFLAGFANGSRYYNLNVLARASSQQSEDPIFRWQRLFYRVYAQDHPDASPIIAKPNVPEDFRPSSDQIEHHVIIAAACPNICWRLVQVLVPLKELLIAIREQVHSDDLAHGGVHANPSVPFMEEFLDFVCTDKTILESKDWLSFD